MPNGGLEKVGVELVAEGAAKFVSDLTKAQQAVGELGGVGSRIASAFPGFGKAIDTVSSKFAGISGKAVAAKAAVTGLKVAIAAIGVAITAAVAILAAFAAAIVAIGIAAFKAAKELAKFVAEGVMLAGRFQEMEFTALAVGRAMGYQEQEIRGAIAAVQDAGIRYDAAATTVAQFARNQIDFASATELANIAQATGIMIGEDSSATMERLTLAIATGSTARLRALGIVFDNQEALEVEAVALGKSVEAMTQAEKAQARVNAIIAAGKPLLDVYSAAMESPTKAMRSLAGRVIPELQASIGQFFLPALMTVVSAISNFVKALTAATAEGGALRPVLIGLGAAASLLADAFAGALGLITDWVSNFQGTLFGGMEATAEGMIR